MTRNMRDLMMIVEGASERDSDDAPPDFLFHGTSSKSVKSIIKEGLRGPNHWGSEFVARYFAREECKETGGRPAIFCIPFSRFQQTHFAVDEQMVEFPIFNDYDVRQIEWEEIEEDGGTPTWSDSLRIYEAVVYQTPISLTDEDLMGGHRRRTVRKSTG